MLCYRYPLMKAVKQALGGGTGPNPTAVPTEGTPPPPPPPNTQPPATAPPSGSCKAIGDWEGNSDMDEWCNDNCSVGYCPADWCKCV